MNGDQKTAPPEGRQLLPDGGTSDAPGVGGQAAAPPLPPVPASPEKQEKQGQQERQSLTATDPAADEGYANSPAGDVIEWVSKDDRSHEKPSGWLPAMIGGVVVLVALVALITRGDKVSIVSVLAFSLLLVFYSRRRVPPVHYRMSNKAIAIGQKPYLFGEFRSFCIVEEHGSRSILLVPFKRFLPKIAVHFSREMEPQVVSRLANALPVEQYHHDLLDFVIRKVRI